MHSCKDCATVPITRSHTSTHHVWKDGHVGIELQMLSPQTLQLLLHVFLNHCRGYETTHSQLIFVFICHCLDVNYVVQNLLRGGEQMFTCTTKGTNI